MDDRRVHTDVNVTVGNGKPIGIGPEDLVGKIVSG